MFSVADLQSFTTNLSSKLKSGCSPVSLAQHRANQSASFESNMQNFCFFIISRLKKADDLRDDWTEMDLKHRTYRPRILKSSESALSGLKCFLSLQTEYFCVFCCQKGQIT